MGMVKVIRQPYVCYDRIIEPIDLFIFLLRALKVFLLSRILLLNHQLIILWRHHMVIELILHKIVLTRFGKRLLITILIMIISAIDIKLDVALTDVT